MEDARRRKGEGAGGGHYRDAGAWLASIRENNGLTLEEAAGRTHIKVRCLQAIEELDVANLPARPYAIGFVKTYAEFLGLDATEAVDAFKHDAGFNVSKPVEPEKFEEAEKAAPVDKPELSLLAVVVILAFVLWCAWQVTLPRDVKQLGSRDDAATPSVVADEQLERVVAPRAPEVDAIEANLIERVEPIYPLGCVNGAAASETVSVAFTVSQNGRVVGERVSATTNGCFNDTALIAVRRWRFEPRMVNGQARTAHDQRVDITFERPL